MEKEKTILDKIIDVLYKVIEFFCVLCLIGQVFLVSYAVFGRLAAIKTPSWCEEISRVLMVWMALLTASLAIKDNSHVQMEVFDKLFGKIGLIIRNIFYAFLNIGLCGIMFWKGLDLVKQSHRTRLAASGLPSSFLYGAACIGGLAMAIMLIYQLWRMLCHKK